MHLNKRTYLPICNAALAAVTLLTLVSTAQATLIAYDGFDTYSGVATTTPDPNTPWVTQGLWDGGTGWTTPWNLGAWYWTGSLTPTSTGLDHTAGNTQAAQFQYPISNSQGTLLGRYFTTQYPVAKPYPNSGYTSGTYYVAAQINLGASATGTTNVSTVDVSLIAQLEYSQQLAGFGLRSNSSGKVAAFIGTNGNSVVTGSYDKTLGSTYWLLAKANLSDGTLSLYTISDLNNPSLPTTPDIVQTGINFTINNGPWYLDGTTTQGFSGVGIANYQNNVDSATNNGTNLIDNIRIADSWQEALGLVLPPPSGTVWNSSTSGNWSTNANWTYGTPNSADAIANLPTTTSATSINIDSNVTLGQLKIGGNSSYTVQGTGALSFISTSGPAVVQVASGTHTLNPAKVEFQSDTSLNLSGNLVLGGTVDGIVVDAGKTVTVNNGGNLIVLGKLHLAGEVVIANKVAGATGSVIVLDSSTAIDGAGSLDLTSNNAIIRNTTETAVVTDLLKSGKLISSVVNSHPSYTALGILSGTDYNAVRGNYLGTISVSATDTVIKYTYTGDANLDGVIDTRDFLQIDSAYLSGLFTTSGASWVNGDSNHDGKIDSTDFALLDAAYVAYTGGSSLALARAAEDARLFGSTFNSVFDQALASVPEPTSLALLGLGALALLKRRR